jgi:three-Cys-motif partner protein
LEFHDDAIVLSGATGTKLKCEILGKYYPKWWSITSGGQRRGNRLPTSIVELNAGTAEDYIEETRETILGSAGHALKLKLEGDGTWRLKVVLVESDLGCFSHLENVIRRNWGSLDLGEAKGQTSSNNTGIYLLNKSIGEAIGIIENIELGNSLFFFDDLLCTPWSEIERVARDTITSYYVSGTEFIIFLFTSDWFLGRPKAGLSPLPRDITPTGWSSGEKGAVSKMDELFGSQTWRGSILTQAPESEKMRTLVSIYKDRLRRWFRYVVPMPFKPRQDQVYHLFACSNNELGITLTRSFYAEFTGNPPYNPNNPLTYRRFEKVHPEEVVDYAGNQRPLTWKMLWAVIKNHEDGICDIHCDDFRQFENDWQIRLDALQWLESEGYLTRYDPVNNPWGEEIPTYKLDWQVVEKNLDVRPPEEFHPLSPQ